jgi:hypothetical protein
MHKSASTSMYHPRRGEGGGGGYPQSKHPYSHSS